MSFVAKSGQLSKLVFNSTRTYCTTIVHIVHTSRYVCGKCGKKYLSGYLFSVTYRYYYFQLKGPPKRIFEIKSQIKTVTIFLYTIVCVRQLKEELSSTYVFL